MQARNRPIRRPSRDRVCAAGIPEIQAPQKHRDCDRCPGRGLLAAFLWRYLSSYESTDDAQADVHLYPVSARISGYVVKVNVDDNQWVQQGTVLVEIDPKDYEVAVAQAQANLASAEATAQSLNITVPITSVNTSSQLKSTASDVENANAGIIAAERQLTAAHARWKRPRRTT
jgi:membrane fusion protein (multidrug efflux system)